MYLKGFLKGIYRGSKGNSGIYLKVGYDPEYGLSNIPSLGEILESLGILSG